MIPVVFITDDAFIMQTSVAILSLLRNKKPETQYDVFVIMAECSDESRQELQRFPEVTVVEASLAAYRGIKQCAHIPIACLLKFNVSELVPQYDKILYIDGDVIIREDLGALYHTDLNENYAAAVRQTMCVRDGNDRINAGVMLFNAKKIRDDGMLEKLVETRLSLGDRGSMDQQTFNLLMGDRICSLPPRYNCVPTQTEEIVRECGIDRVNAFFDTAYASALDMMKDAAIIHYATEFKPWKYVHVPCGDEWYQYYLKSPYGDKPLMRYNKWQARRERLKNAWKQGGFAGILGFVKGTMKRKLDGKNMERNWG